jgi:copper chaperone CopZ
MKSLLKIVVAITLLLSSVVMTAQIKNLKTETVKIYGNCGTCKKAIEKAGNLKGVATVNWNKDSKMAILTYDSSKTNQSEILKKIALAGYDSDKIKSKKEDYESLPGCCQYDRK